MYVKDLDTGELLAQEMVGSLAEAQEMVYRVVRVHGRLRLRVEHCLGGSVVIDHLYPSELGPRPELEP
jgi:hypothetical protein